MLQLGRVEDAVLVAAVLVVLDQSRSGELLVHNNTVQPHALGDVHRHSLRRGRVGRCEEMG